MRRSPGSSTVRTLVRGHSFPQGAEPFLRVPTRGVRVQIIRGMVRGRRGAGVPVPAEPFHRSKEKLTPLILTLSGTTAHRFVPAAAAPALVTARALCPSQLLDSESNGLGRAANVVGRVRAVGRRREARQTEGARAGSIARVCVRTPSLVQTRAYWSLRPQICMQVQHGSCSPGLPPSSRTRPRVPEPDHRSRIYVSRSSTWYLDPVCHDYGDFNRSGRFPAVGRRKKRCCI